MNREILKLCTLRGLCVFSRDSGTHIIKAHVQKEILSRVDWVFFRHRCAWNVKWFQFVLYLGSGTYARRGGGPSVYQENQKFYLD